MAVLLGFYVVINLQSARDKLTAVVSWLMQNQFDKDITSKFWISGVYACNTDVLPWLLRWMNGEKQSIHLGSGIDTSKHDTWALKAWA